MKKTTEKKVVIVGGCGHVGLPLGVKFALAGLHVHLIDLDAKKVQKVLSGSFPFEEKGGDEQLKDALAKGLTASNDPGAAADADIIIFVTGTPVDEHLTPKLSDVTHVFDQYSKYFTPSTLVVMRSTLFPGTMEHLANTLLRKGNPTLLAFCPERVAQGVALEEIDALPQIVSAFDEPSFDAAYELFKVIAPFVIRLSPIEAELAKLIANSWRYLEFAIANQFYMIAEKNGIDFYRVYDAVRYDYRRATGYKSPGFSAGPCLFKDTMQLAAFFKHQFYLGHSAMLVNEGLADFVVEKTKHLLGGELLGRKIGILGMTFKADNDDTRESLSFRVKKALSFGGADVLCTDPYLPELESLERTLEEAEILVLCTPHREYRELKYKKPVIDVWGQVNRSTLDIYPGLVPQAEK